MIWLEYHGQSRKKDGSGEAEIVGKVMDVLKMSSWMNLTSTFG